MSKISGTTSNEVSIREKENRALAREIAAEGFVLLKNKNQVLPFKEGQKIGLYGAGAVKTIKGGTGSGDVNERYSVSIWEGLKNAGLDITSTEWLSSYEKFYNEARLKWRDIIFEANKKCHNFFEAYSTHPFYIPSGDPIQEADAIIDGASVAIYVLSRVAGEGKDRTVTEGDFFLTKEERAQIEAVSKSYESVVLVINAGGILDLSFTDELPNIDGIIQFLQAGEEGGNALADVLLGKVTPSGKLTDSWAYAYEDYPSANTFSYFSGDTFKEEYFEGIYVGYRYFDTFNKAVRYPFGFGLSYTQFELKAGKMGFEGLGTKNASFKIAVDVQNMGNTYAGKEVVEIFVACPQEGLEKEFRRLIGYQKTNTLKPGEKVTVEVKASLYQMASYDESKAAWVLEKGRYGIFAGNSIADAKVVGSFELEETVILVQCKHICPLQQELQQIHADKQEVLEKTSAWQKAAADLWTGHLQATDLVKEVVDYDRKPARLEEAKSIVEKMTVEELIALATGDVNSSQEGIGACDQSVPGAAAETTRVAEHLGIGSIALADGPAGLRLRRKFEVLNGKVHIVDGVAALENGFFEPEHEPVGETYYQYCTAFPVGTLLAQTWNTELIERFGQAIGREMQEFHVTLWLAPGICLHRNPLCGRNFEYYSEDPLVTGITAAKVTAGVQSYAGCGTTIKHFAANNQEDNRIGSDSVLSERVLRELYIKAFEIAVKEAQPKSIMTSYNLINGIHTANSYDLCTNAARREWGFEGAIMTDWGTTDHPNHGISTASGCMRAGNDMVMPGSMDDHENLQKELQEGTLSLEQLKECVLATVDLILKATK